MSEVTDIDENKPDKIDLKQYKTNNSATKSLKPHVAKPKKSVTMDLYSITELTEVTDESQGEPVFSLNHGI